MNALGLWIVTLIYAGQSAVWIYQGKLAEALILIGYVIAGVGLIIQVGHGAA